MPCRYPFPQPTFQPPHRIALLAGSVVHDKMPKMEQNLEVKPNNIRNAISTLKILQLLLPTPHIVSKQHQQQQAIHNVVLALALAPACVLVRDSGGGFPEWWPLQSFRSGNSCRHACAPATLKGHNIIPMHNSIVMMDLRIWPVLVLTLVLGSTPGGG